jgi:N utilization substance protein A
MNGEVLRIVDSIHRDKNIDKEIVFQGIEMALLSAAKKHYPETDEITISIDRETGSVTATHNAEPIAPEVLGRIAAQSAKQIIIQKIREAERDALYDEYSTRVGDIIHGTVQRVEGGAVTINVGKTEGILPRGEQIPGESHHVGERVRAVIYDVRKTNQRVKIILSRSHPDFVRRLFELEIPEIAEKVIEIKALAREAGYRSKVAVASIDSKVDCVGACVGVRGTRIKNIVDELAGERIDIVRWNESLQVMIPNALQPAEVQDVMMFSMLGRAIVLVKEDQLSLAIGRRGQNVRLASKLVGWDIEIMTTEELDEQIERAVGLFSTIPNVDGALIDRFVEQGFLSFDDLSVMDPQEMAQLEGLDVVKASEIIDFAEREAERLGREAPAPARTAEREPAVGAEAAEEPAAEPQAEEAGAAEAGTEERGEAGAMAVAGAEPATDSETVAGAGHPASSGDEDSATA